MDRMVLDSQSETKFELLSRSDLAGLSPQRMERFLERLVNLGASNEKKRQVFSKQFADMLPTHNLPPALPGLYQPLVSGDFLFDEAQPALREAWRESRPLIKEASLMLLAGRYMMRFEGSKSLLEQVLGFRERPDGFLLTLLHALKNVHRLKYCLNDECRRPYFVAARKAQVYCSTACAAPSKREAKLRWWREHGDARRKMLMKKRGKHAKAKKA